MFSLFGDGKQALPCYLQSVGAGYLPDSGEAVLIGDVSFGLGCGNIGMCASRCHLWTM